MGRGRGHGLVVGGTGMLRETVRVLSLDREITLVSRGAGRAGGPSIHPAPADYRGPSAFAAALDAAVAARGPFDLAVAWIHSHSPDAPLVAARRVKGRFFHVLGSSAADPSAADPARRAAFEALPGLSYHEVILGFVLEGDGSRWLTDPEIAGGVLAAVSASRPRFVVGTVTPWERKP